MTGCTCTQPGRCESRGIDVRWAEIQTCPHRRKQAPPLWDTGCSDCTHASDPLRDASGDIIGTKGCGCGGGSKPSGNQWIRCGLADNKLMMEPIGKRCIRKEKKSAVSNTPTADL